MCSRGAVCNCAPAWPGCTPAAALCMLRSSPPTATPSHHPTQPPRCDDSLRNGGETDVDCGGPTCAPCLVDQFCKVSADCVTGVCKGYRCQPKARPPTPPLRPTAPPCPASLPESLSLVQLLCWLVAWAEGWCREAWERLAAPLPRGPCAPSTAEPLPTAPSPAPFWVCSLLLAQVTPVLQGGGMALEGMGAGRRWLAACGCVAAALCDEELIACRHQLCCRASALCDDF